MQLVSKNFQIRRNFIFWTEQWKKKPDLFGCLSELYLYFPAKLLQIPPLRLARVLSPRIASIATGTKSRSVCDCWRTRVTTSSATTTCSSWYGKSTWPPSRRWMPKRTRCPTTWSSSAKVSVSLLRLIAWLIRTQMLTLPRHTAPLISPATFCKVFPFHLMFDRQMKIVQAGKAVSRVIPRWVLANGLQYAICLWAIVCD